MKLGKLNFNEFEQNAMSFSSLKSIVGGLAAEYTYKNGKIYDFIDNIGGTSFECDPEKYDDNVCA